MNPKHIIFLCLQAVVALSPSAHAECQYPNELPGFRFCGASTWKSLVPLVSTISDVRSVLGEPLEAVDLAHYGSAYPGDANAQQPVLTYAAGQDWQLLVYLVKTDAFARERYPRELYDRLLSLDLVPKRRMPIASVEFPPAFKKRHIVAADAEWDEYADGTGLVYSVYTSRPAHRDAEAGDLERVSYGVRDPGR